MAKRCPHCGYVVEDEEKLFCSKCGELMDRKISDDLKLLNDIDKTLDEYNQSKSERPTQKKQATPINNATPRRRNDDDDDDMPIKKMSKPAKKQSNPLPIIIIAIIVIAIIIKVALF